MTTPCSRLVLFILALGGKCRATNIISTVAGRTEGGSVWSPSTESQAIDALLNEVHGVATDSSGDVYFSERNCNVVRKVTVSTGALTTFAGTGSGGFSGDSGAASSAQLSEPFGIVFDAADNMYIADKSNCCVRKVAASDATISTFAGTCNSCDHGTTTGDGGNAVNAGLHEVYDVAVDSSNNVFIALPNKHCIKKVTGGIISTFAGTCGTSGSTGNGGQATSGA